jgi:hypothetical protein
MVPRLEFGYLLCTYLPSLPLSLVLLLIANELPDHEVLKQYLKDHETLYFIVLPLLIGLFIDGTRHTLAGLCLGLQRRLMYGDKSLWRCLVSNFLKSMSIFFFWPRDDQYKDKMKKGRYNYEPEYFSRILTRFVVQHQLYEFFINFGISAGLATGLLWKFNIGSPSHWIIGFSVAFLSILLSASFKLLHGQLKSFYFPDISVKEIHERYDQDDVRRCGPVMIKYLRHVLLWNGIIDLVVGASLILMPTTVAGILGFPLLTDAMSFSIGGWGVAALAFGLGRVLASRNPAHYVLWAFLGLFEGIILSAFCIYYWLGTGLLFQQISLTLFIAGGFAIAYIISFPAWSRLEGEG